MEVAPSHSSSGVVRHAVLLSLTEIGCGGVIHALNLPLGGHLLSLNEAWVLTLATRGSAGRGEGMRRASAVGTSAALLKSLSPLGKKVSPMVAIALQAQLFATGVAMGGANRFGAMLGSALLSVWAFLHPLVVAFVIFGSTLFEAIEKAWVELASKLGWDPSLGWELLGAVVLAKAALAAAGAWVVWGSGAEAESRYLARLERWIRVTPLARASAPRVRSTGALAARDLLHPAFLVPWILATAFFFWGQHASGAETALYALRALATAYFLAWAIRAWPRSWSEGAFRRFPALREVADQVARERSRIRSRS